nr:reverse transcriptase domain-containing protein [Tanacetum cinerariifolium]
MTGDRLRLRNFVKKFIGTVRFGNDHFGAIMGYGDYVIGDSVIFKVYYVEGIVELIKGSRGSNFYTISVEDMMKSSPICLWSKASKTKSWLWHRRLNHLNFGPINNLKQKSVDMPYTSYTWMEALRWRYFMNTASTGSGQKSRAKWSRRLRDAKHYTRAWMNFMIVRSPSPYNGIIGRPVIREIQAVPSTGHGMLKFLMNDGIVTIRSTILTPIECTTIAATLKDQAKKAEAHKIFKVAIHPDFSDQEITIGGTVSIKARTKLCTLEEKLRYISMAAVRHDRSTTIDYRTPTQYPRRILPYLNKACLQDCYPLLEIDWKVESFCGYPFKCFLDAYKGYHQIHMAEQDEEKTAFHTSHGSSRRNVSRIHDKSKRDKTVPRQDGGYVTPPIPRTIKEVQSINGKLASLNRFISKSAEKSLPLFKTLKKCIKKSDFHWTPDAAISVVLMTERDTVQTPVYFMSRTLQSPELNYTPMEKLVLALVCATKRLCKYFQAHPIAVITDQPVKQVMSRAGLILTSPEGTEFTYALRFQFTASNNEAEYEALIAGLRIAAQMGVRNVHAVISKAVAKVCWTTPSELCDPGNSRGVVQYARGTTVRGGQGYRIRVLLANHASRRTRSDTHVQCLSRQGKIKFLIVAMDYFTKWIEAKAVATITDSQVKKFVWYNIVCRFGLPGEIVLDNRKQFSDNPFKDWCEKLNITQRFASVTHPQSNVLVERAKRSLGEGIKARLGEGNKNWIEELPHVLWAHRTLIKSSHGDTLFSLTYGTEAVIPADFEMPTYRTAVVDAVHNNEELRLNLDLLEERHECAAIREAKAKLKMTKYYNTRVRGVTFRHEDFVYRSNEASHAMNGGKLGPK